MNDQKRNANYWLPLSRPFVLALILIVLAALAWRTGRKGLGGFFTSYAATTNRLNIADSAVRLSSGSADAHYVRATILEASDLAAAVREHYEAVTARPNDYALWLSLARALELNGDPDAAIAAARQAIPLAPAYAQPHYQLGNLLVRSGQTKEAFAELRLAGTSDPTLLPGIVDLAWRVSSHNVQFVEEAVSPVTPQQHWIVARFFRGQSQIDSAVREFAMSGTDGEPDRRAYVQQLIQEGQFAAAAELWRVDNPEGAQVDVVRNPGFETEIELGESEFSWRAPQKIEGVHFVLDTQKPAEGQSSVKLDFTGNVPVSSPLLSQIVLVQSETQYELQFSARTESIVSGGLPVVSIVDSVSRNRLAQSQTLAGTTAAWAQYTIKFASGTHTQAVLIVVERQSCPSNPCPIFGRLWLDGFRLNKR